MAEQVYGAAAPSLAEPWKGNPGRSIRRRPTIVSRSSAGGVSSMGDGRPRPPVLLKNG